jgi:methionyl-tRNA formyltransferase
MSSPIRIIYMGTPDFAVSGLENIITNGYNVVAVITAPDKPAGRGLQIQMSPVKEAALKHNIPVLQPERLKNPLFLEELKSYHADLQIVVAFRMLPEVVWNMPGLGTFNLHASLLPQYRGAAPINWAIINGEKLTGVTTFFLKQEIDTGDILLQETEPIFDTDDAGLLYNRLMNKGAEVIVKTLQLITQGNYKTTPQLQSETVKTAPKIFKETCQIDWNTPAIAIHNFVRGLSPLPTAWTILPFGKVKIYKTAVVESHSQNISELSTDNANYLQIQTSDGAIAIIELQLEGKKRMPIKDFLRGNKIINQ